MSGMNRFPVHGTMRPGAYRDSNQKAVTMSSDKSRGRAWKCKCCIRTTYNLGRICTRCLDKKGEV